MLLTQVSNDKRDGRWAIEYMSCGVVICYWTTGNPEPWTNRGSLDEPAAPVQIMGATGPIIIVPEKKAEFYEKLQQRGNEPTYENVKQILIEMIGERLPHDALETKDVKDFP